MDPFFRRRRRFEGVLQVLALEEAFDRMDRRRQEAFLALKFPDPIIEFDADIDDGQMHPGLKKVIERNFAEATIELDNGEVSVRDFFSTLAGLYVVVRNSINQSGAPAACEQFMREALPVLANAYETGLARVWDSLHRVIITPLVALSRLDTRIFFVRAASEVTKRLKSQVRLTIAASTPQTQRVALDGIERPMLRVGTGNGWQDVRWVSWNRETLGCGVSGPKMPVYIQSHGLKQLHARLNLPPAKDYLEYWLYESLNAPQIVERQGDDLLVEYRIRDDRLGYLIVTPTRDCAAVRTFKFLTMENTPEARQLNQQLRLSRREVDWLGLSDLTAFTQTDLRDDPKLRSIFEECGCEHLFRLAEEDEWAFAPETKPLAAEMRKFLKMAA